MSDRKKYAAINWLSMAGAFPKYAHSSADEDGDANFHGQTRKNDTHTSTADPRPPPRQGPP
jgi:hypothetical protein